MENILLVIILVEAFGIIGKCHPGGPVVPVGHIEPVEHVEQSGFLVKYKYINTPAKINNIIAATHNNKDSEVIYLC